MSSLFGDSNLLTLSLLPICFGAALGVFTGRVSRAGPGRAVSIALKSLISPSQRPFSMRSSELHWLRGHLAAGNWGDDYISVTGPKGIGKSCLLRTALDHTAGVVKVNMSVGQSPEDLRVNVMRAVTNLSLYFQNPEPSFRRVIFWHRLITFGKLPFVVINLVERDVGDTKSKIRHTIRTLASDYKLRVIIDASPNTLERRALKSGRCMQLEVGPMSSEILEKIPEWAVLREQLKACELYDLALVLLSGSPLHWNAVNKAFIELAKDTTCSNELNKLLGRELSRVYEDALDTVNESVTEGDVELDRITQLYFKNGERLRAEGLKRPKVDKIFHVQGPLKLLEPSSSAIRLVLKLGRDKIPTLDDLQQYVKSGQ